MSAVTWWSMWFTISRPAAISKPIMARALRLSARNFRTRCLDDLVLRETFLCFTNYLYIQTGSLTAILISRLPGNYLPQANSFEAIFFACIILLVLLVTPRWRRLHHFCAALAVTCKVRLCLHPRGMLRVQSLHLPVFAGLARRCL